MANLYWQDSGSQAWEDVLNWWTDDAATTQAANAPWVDGVDSTYLAYDLTLSLLSSGAPIIGAAIGNNATGTCDLVAVQNSGTINGGAFSGAYFVNDATINNGTFSGFGFSSAGNIFGGTFTESFGNSGNIFGGTFTSDSITNNGLITAGTFTGSFFTNNLDIFGGTFSGSIFSNAGYIAGGTFTGSNVGNIGQIDGGTFSGSGFVNYGTITSGTFIYPSVNISTAGGNTFLSLTGFGPVFGYPTPASGGGSDQTIARLLNLPWFINL
jgi:hypothetical protein